MFHVELKQFPHSARAFNLSRDQLDQRFLGPWHAGKEIEYSDRRWSSEKAKMTIYEGPSLAPEQIGMGRGWGNVTRSGDDVTARLLAESGSSSPSSVAASEIEQFKLEIAERAAVAPQSLRAVVGLANARYPERRASDRLAFAEQAVWELLHQGRLALQDADSGQAVPRERWEATVLAWDTWVDNRFELAPFRSTD